MHLKYQNMRYNSTISRKIYRIKWRRKNYTLLIKINFNHPKCMTFFTQKPPGPAVLVYIKF